MTESSEKRQVMEIFHGLSFTSTFSNYVSSQTYICCSFQILQHISCKAVTTVISDAPEWKPWRPGTPRSFRL